MSAINPSASRTVSALDQYLDLYSNERSAFEANSPELLNRRREEASRRLERAGRLPDKQDEGFQKTSIEEMFAYDFGVNVSRVNIPVDIADSFRCDVPNISTLLAITVNDRFIPTTTLLKNLPEGVTVCSLRTAPPELLEQYLGKMVKHDDIAAAFNDLLLQDGVLIHVSRNITVEKPIQIVDIFSSPTPLLGARRVLVVAEEGAKVAILKCDHTQTPGVRFASSEIIEIHCGPSASVDWYDLEESSPETARWCKFLCRQEARSQLNICVSTLTNGTTRNEYRIDAEGDGTQTQLSGMALGTGSRHIDNSSQLYHHAGHGHSDQLFKYVLDDQASGAFEGTIEVGHDARFNEAYQSNRNLLASEKAKMHTRPQLLIYNDDVNCSHGASTGQLDQQALFYMQARGIPREEARKMLMQAFMVDIIEKIRVENLRDRLRHLLEIRLSGSCADSGCSSCRK